MTVSECHYTDENHQFLLKYDGRVDFPAVLPSPWTAIQMLSEAKKSKKIK
jgi:hypothetical protein